MPHAPRSSHPGGTPCQVNNPQSIESIDRRFSQSDFTKRTQMTRSGTIPSTSRGWVHDASARRSALWVGSVGPQAGEEQAGDDLDRRGDDRSVG